MNKDNYSKLSIERMYNELIDLLRSSNEQLDDIQGKNKQIRELQSGLIATLKRCVSNVECETQLALNTISWDKLVIAFFGETNAGKSTIIETFRILFDKDRPRKRDGLIVGDGRHDFTKDYKEYNLSIDGRPFVLIDVPGIEGDEDNFKDVIKDALRKAHCVFYVHGHNKKPDKGTAAKIKAYLGDWVNVYSIQNIRSDVSYYDEEDLRETLLTPNVHKSEELIKSSFKDILGDVYKGNISLQALLAMCAKAEFADSRPDLQKNQKKLLKYFGSSDEILRFSQFQTIINLVKSKSANFTQEIIEANKQKAISLASLTKREIDNEINKHNEECAELENRLKQFRRDVVQYIGNTKLSVKRKMDAKVDQSFSSLKNGLNSIIDGDSSKDAKNKRSNHLVKCFQRDLPKDLSEIVKYEIDTLNRKIGTKKKSLEGISFKTLYVPYINFSDLSFDIESAMGELDFNLEDLGDSLLSVSGGAVAGATLGSVIPGVGTAIGACVGAGVGFLKNVILGKDKKAEAQQAINEELESVSVEVKKRINGISLTFGSNLETLKKQLTASIKSEIDNIEEIDENVSFFVQRIDSYVMKIKSNEYGKV